MPLSPYLAGPECRRVWEIRADQVVKDPASAAWVTGDRLGPRARLAVGRAGYHGPPDDDGMVEVGYSIDPQYRRQGYARAALRALLARAEAEPGRAHASAPRSRRTTSPRGTWSSPTGWSRSASRRTTRTAWRSSTRWPSDAARRRRPRLIRRARPRSRHRHPDARRRARGVVASTGRPRSWPSVPSRRGTRHAELLTPAITSVLDDAGLRMGDLDVVLTGLGPGPFTGLRVGVVTAAALADARLASTALSSHANH